MTGIVLALGAIVSVLAFGGVEVVAFAPVQALVALAAVVQFWRRGWPSVSRLTLFVIGVLTIVPLLQLVPLPRTFITEQFPERAVLASYLESLAAPITSAAQKLPLTLSAQETQIALLRLVCYILVFLLGFQLYRSRENANVLIGVLIWLGVFEATCGIVQYMTGWQYYIYYDRWVYAPAAAGTYVNQDHFAGMLEMVLPFLVARILFRRLNEGAGRRSALVRAMISPSTSHILRDLVLFAVIGVGLAFSGSRMGIAGAAAGIVMVGTLALLEPHRRSSLGILLIILALPAAYSLWIGIEPVVQRFEEIGGSKILKQDRIPVWRDTLSLIRDYPITGTGLGTYRWSSLHYQTYQLPVLYQHAHNDYLEYAADIGIPGAVILFGGLWILAIKTARRSHLLQRQRNKVAAAGCAGAMAAILIHGITDFNLQIPANAFLFAWISGTAAAVVRSRQDRQDEDTPE